MTQHRARNGRYARDPVWIWRHREMMRERLVAKLDRLVEDVAIAIGLYAVAVFLIARAV
jgi:hypothetical protein